MTALAERPIAPAEQRDLPHPQRAPRPTFLAVANAGPGNRRATEARRLVGLSSSAGSRPLSWKFPIFIRKEQRTRGHVFIAMRALKVLRVMEQRLSAAFATTDTHAEAENPDSALGALSRLCLQHYTIGDRTIVGLPRADARQQRILDALQVKLIAPWRLERPNGLRISTALH